MENDLLIAQLTNVTNHRIDEHQTWVNAFYFSLTTNALLLIALLSLDNSPSILPVICLVSVIGILITFLLIIVQTRARLSMEAYENLREKLEVKLDLNEFSVTTAIASRPSSRIPKARPYMERANYFITLLWFVLFIYYLVG
ncbi:MAG: hypothetical protein HOC71_09065 [Candidatus Latescibacteria bacterium]|jgi:hypothetical protein|nr:hypothetical protein [Candidatus Latescibacterota bacterium]